MFERIPLNQPSWQWCTAEGAEMHSLLMGLESTFREKIQWLEEAENFVLAMEAYRRKPLMQSSKVAEGPESI